MTNAQQRSRLTPAVYRRRRIVAAVIATAVLGLGGWGAGTAATALARPLPAAQITLSTPVDQTGPASEISYPSTGRSAFSASGFDGLLGFSGDQSAAPIASMTKVVTALVVLDAHPIAATEDGPIITFSAEDVAIRESVIAQNGSNAPVFDGLQLTERQALTAMLLPSANNYAISLARWGFGSDESFVAATATWLAANGLADTTIAEPTGLSPLNTATPADLVTLGQLAETNPIVANIVALPRADLPGVGTVENTNTLLGQDGIVGVKTGTTDEAGSCLLFAARIMVGPSEVLLVGVVMGGDSHESVDADVRALVQSASAGFRSVVVATAGQTIGSATSAWGEQTALLAAQDLVVVGFSDRAISLEPRIELTTAAAGQAVGTISARSGTQNVSSAVTAQAVIAEPGPWWRLTHPER